MNDLDTEYVAIAKDGKIFTTVTYEGFPFTVLWAPVGGNSPFACIETWAGMADFEGHDGELCRKKGMQRVEAGARKEFVSKISI